MFGKRLDGHAENAPLASQGEGDRRQPQPFHLAKMPPDEAVAGTFKDSSGKPIRVAPLSNEDRRTLIRWIDLGCSIDQRFSPGETDPASSPFTDRTLPTLTIARPSTGVSNEPLTQIVIGMADAASGLDLSSFSVTADVAIDGAEPGRQLSTRFKQTAPGIWALSLKEPVSALARGTLTVQVSDRDRNVTRIERTFAIK
jgi:hypothetical protein